MASSPTTILRISPLRLKHRARTQAYFVRSYSLKARFKSLNYYLPRLVSLKQRSAFTKFSLTFFVAIRKGSDYSLSNAFGEHAYQTPEELIISKIDVPGNNPEQFFANLIVRWADLFEDSRRIRVKFFRYSIIYQKDYFEKQSFTIALLTPFQKNSLPSPDDFLL